MSGINELIEVIRKEGSRGYVEPLFYATITKSHPEKTDSIVLMG